MHQFRKADKIVLCLSIFLYLLLSASCTDPADSGGSSDIIIADHTIVDKYTDIPANYIAEVKKMWINIMGESHSGAYREGLELLEAIDSRFAVNVTESGTPEGATDAHLRSSRVRRTSSWTDATGEANFWTNTDGANNLKNHVDYCETYDLHITAIGFGWCWDMTIGGSSPTADPIYQCRWYGAGGTAGWWGLDDDDSAINCLTYCKQVDDYNDYCKTQGYTTRFIFTTGTVDGYEGESGYQGYLKNQYIRDYVKAGDRPRILFDYADILCYNDAGSLKTTSWTINGIEHQYPFIHDDNRLPTVNAYHIAENGAIRLAKAQWWLLARMAGWDGQPEK